VKKLYLYLLTFAAFSVFNYVFIDGVEAATTSSEDLEGDDVIGGSEYTGSSGMNPGDQVIWRGPAWYSGWWFSDEDNYYGWQRENYIGEPAHGYAEYKSASPSSRNTNREE